jgi:predicted CXXCH cytochrome family protein
LQRTTQPQTCLKCHDKPLKTTEGKSLTNMSLLLANNPDKHGPIRDGQCTACHDPHAAKMHNLLSEEYPSTFYSPFSMDMYKLCFKCHEPALVTRMNGQGVTQFRDGGRNLHALHVNQEKGRTCRACHEVHASKRPAHVRESVPFGSSTWMLEINFEKGEQGGSCAPGCHAPKKYDRISPVGPTTTAAPAATAAATAPKPAPAPAPAAQTPATPPESKP